MRRKFYLWNGLYQPCTDSHGLRVPYRSNAISTKIKIIFLFQLQTTTLSSSILLITITVLACIWSVQGMSNVVYTTGGTVYCDQCPSGTSTYTQRRYITIPSQTYTPPYYNVQGRVVNNPSSLLSSDNTITQEIYSGTVDSN